MGSGEPSVSRPMEVRLVAEGVHRVGLFREGRPPDYASPALADHPAAGEPASLPFEPEFAGFADGRPRLVVRRAPGERFFACGERTAGLEKTGSHQVFWNVDPPAGHTASFNNLYTSIPFVLGLADGVARGVFLDNPGWTEIDLAKASDDEVVFETRTGNL